MTLARDLLGAEWSARRRAYLALGVLLAATSATYHLVLSSVDGLEEGVGAELSAALGGDVRIARGDTGVGDGRAVQDLRDVLAGLRFAAPGAAFSPRLETEAIFLHGSDFTSAEEAENASRAAAILVGLDPAADWPVTGLPAFREQGLMLGDPAIPEYRLPTGERLVPLVVGEEFLRGGNLTVANGTFNWSSVYNVTTGHVENGQLVRIRGVVVGTYSTGFRMIDRLVAYAPRGDVARLMGHFPTNPPANVILARTSDPHGVAEAARARGFEAMEADDFRQSYLGPVFLGVRVTAWIVVVALTAMTAAWVAATLARQVGADRQKIATLRAIGIPEEAFARVYRTICGALGLAGGLVGVVASALLALGLGALLRAALPHAPTPSPGLLEALLIVGLTTLASVGAAEWALRRLRRIPIRDALEGP